MDRTMQITRNLPETYEMLINFQRLVPNNATVALCTIGPEYEYPLFGEKLGRTIIPINNFAGRRSEIPSNADYILFTGNCMDPLPGDILLAKRFHLHDIYLRKIR